MRLLQIRLVSRKFRDLAWRAFGKLLGETVFDVASQESMNTIHAIAGQRKLLPWMQKLTFSCNVFLGEVGDDPIFSGKGREETDWLRFSFKCWIADVDFGVSEMESLSQLPSWKVMNTSLVNSMRAFNNVERITYVWDEDLPPQHYKNLWLHKTGQNTTPEYPRNEAICAHFGLSFVIDVLTSAGIHPRSLDLAVELDNTYDFFTYMPSQVFPDLCTKVESLTLRDKYCPVANQDMNVEVPSIAVTKATFPLLKSLTIDQNHNDLRTPAPFPLGHEAPILTHLTVLNSADEDQYIQSLLEHYGNHLQRLDLENMVPQCYDGLFDTIAALNLETLLIRQGSEDEWIGASKGLGWPEHWHTWDPDRDYYLLAKDTVLEPRSYRACWERFWCWHNMDIVVNSADDPTPYEPSTERAASTVLAEEEEGDELRVALEAENRGSD
ncbi:uncharacterized protein EKO05_0001846 [Ascochyta rabiei]|uniref:Uncharacterized protein n=1 Tax=Didymella rabiei TaxID=5454 RepID=A0A163I4J0_DIDRA|nr:uncharacterized protein EKO05_0001846 [Ascochyta rabiei]KZM25603.1 hypothetical protein ST47_g3233 [Ascochyta rabiei]UPX11228.1 hypothetical protein EKO05_0001846 [Ascochyta rabiei]